MKLLIKLGLVLLIGLLLLGGAGYFLMPPAAKKAIESGTNKVLGTDTTLETIKAGFGFGSTSMGMAGFTANQPTGFEGPPFLEIGEIDVSVSTFSVLRDTVKVPEVRLDGLKLRLVQNGTESNFLQVYESVRKITASTGEAPAEAPEDSGGGKSVDIGIVKVSGVEASFDLTGIPGIDKSYRFELPAFEFDMSRKANETRIQNVEQATAKLVETLIEQTVARAKTEVSPELAALIGGDISGLKDRVNQELEKLGALADDKFNEIKEQAKQELQDKVGAELGNQLGGILDKGGAGDIKEGLKKGAGDLLDGAGDKLLKGDTESNLKKEADGALKKGGDALNDKLGGLLGGKKGD